MKQKLRVFLTLLLCAVASVGWGEKITDYNNIVSGKKYYIGATTGSTDYYLSVDGGSLSTSIAGTAVTSKTDATAFTFAGSETSWSIQFENGYYLSLKNSKDNGRVQVVENSSIFTASNQSSKIRLSIGDYSIQKNNSGTQFGSYGNTQTDVWLEEVPNVAPTTYTVTFNAGDGTFVGNTDFPNESNTKEAGTYTLPSATPALGYTFDGWMATGSTTPVTGSYTVSGDVDFIAQYTQSGSDEENMVTDRITENDFEKNNSYIDFTINDKPSGVIYKGNAANPSTKSYLQFRSSNNSGLVVTNSSCKVHTIRIQWNTNTTSGRTVDIYGSDTPYTATSNLYTSSTQGTKLGSLSYDGNTNTTSLEVTGDYSYIGVRSNSGAIYLNYIEIIWEKQGGAPSPSISADNVEIAYSAEDGVINYSITNAVEGGELTASTTATWLYLGDVETNSVPFTCSANETTEPRTATITLSYTYGENETVTKNVTVTQAGNPNVVNNISDITAAGTYAVQGTIVAKSQRGFVVGDGTGYVYYYNTNYTQSDYNIGDKVKLSGSVVAYGGVFEFDKNATITAVTESNYVAEEPTVLTGEQMDSRVGLSTAQLSAYIQYEGTLSISSNYYNINNIDGALTAIGSISFPLNTDDFASLDGKTVKVTGYYVGVSSDKYYNTMLGSIEEVKDATPIIDANDVTLNYDATSGEIAYTVNNAVEGKSLSAETTADWISNVSVGESKITFTTTVNEGTEDRSATFTLSYTGAEDKTVTVTQGHYMAPGEWVLTNLADLTENDVFVIVGTYDEDGSSYAMSNNNGTSAPNAVAVTVVENTLSGEIAEDLQWNIGVADNCYTFYPNGTTESWLYCTNTNNGVKVGTNANKTFTVSEEGYLVNTATNRYIGVYNSQDWRCYTSIGVNIADQSFSFYKKVESTPQTVEVTISAAATDGSVNYGTLYYRNMNLTVPEGVTAYTASVSNGSLTLSAVTGAIPAGTGVVLKTASKLTQDTPFTFTEATEAGTVAVDNMLLGTDDVATTTAPEGSTGTYKFYALSLNGSNSENSVGFYYRKGRPDGGAFENGAHKAYLAVPADVAGGAKGFTFGDMTDGIEAINNSQSTTDKVYNLAGQRVQKATKGVYIVNGKKVVVK